MLASVTQVHSQRRPALRRQKQPQLRLGMAILTPRERQVIEQRYAGLAYKELAPKLGISIFTAKKHACNAFEKLGVGSTMQAARILFA